MLTPAAAWLILRAAAGSPDDPVPLAPPAPGYALAWSDEFDGPAGAPDPAKWKPWAVGKRRDAINTVDAARLDGSGHLVIGTSRVERPPGHDPSEAAARKESAESRTSPWEYRTGGVWTKDLYEPTFGFFEARIRFQSRLGHWGAFWLNCEGMGARPGDQSRSATGGGEGGVEMDVIEFHHKMKNGAGQRTAQQTLHWDGYASDHQSRGHTPCLSFNPADDFHVYAMSWTADEHVFFIDGIETWRVPRATKATDDKGRPVPTPVPSTRPEYLIFSLEVGNWAGKAPERDAETWPDSMVVDWVRVWSAPKERP